MLSAPHCESKKADRNHENQQSEMNAFILQPGDHDRGV